MDNTYVLSDEEEAKVYAGIEAQSLLDHPAFMHAIERVRNQCAEQILTSNPERRDQREDLYNLSRGLSAVTAELMAVAAEGQSILQNAERSNETDEVHPDDQDDDAVQY